MRNMRGALWALGLAGAAYLWKNRGRLQQQYGRRLPSYEPQQLPDYGTTPERLTPERNSTWEQPRERNFGGSDV